MMAKYSAVSTSAKLALGGTTRSMLAPGAMACAHSTSMLISGSVAPQVGGVDELIILKLLVVSAGKPYAVEKVFASALIVGDPHQSMMTIVCPVPSNPSS